MKIKTIKALLLCLLCISCLCSCLPHTELDEQAIVEAIGIDFSEGKYNVTVQYFKLEGSGGNNPIDASKPNVTNISGSGDSVSAAIESAELKCGRSFMYGITAVIVIGREALGQDVIKTLSFAESFYQSNPNLLIAAADEKAEDVLKVKFKEGIISVQKLKMLLNNEQYRGFGENVKILELLTEQRRPHAGTAIPLLAVKETGNDSTEDGKNVQLTGGILLTDAKYAADLTLSDLSGLQALGKKTENITVSADIGGEKIYVILYDITSSVTHKLTENQLVFDVKIQSNGKYTDNQLENKDASFSTAVEKLCGQALSERIRGGLENTAIKYGCDPCGLKYAVTSHDYKDWLRIENSFEELLKTAEFNISCDVDINRFGISH